MGLSTRRVAAALLVVILLAGCATNESPAPGATDSPGATASGHAPGPSVEPGALRVGPLDPSIVMSALPQGSSLDPQALGAQAAAMIADLRTSVNASELYGSVADDEATALDKAESDALSALADQVQAKLGVAATTDAALADYRVPTGSPRGGQDTGLLSIGWVFVLVLSSISIGSFDPRVGDVPELSFSQPLAGSSNASTISGNVTMTMSTTGGVVSARVALNGSATRTIASSGRPVTTTGEASYAFTINPCPDPGGGVAGTLAITDDETVSSPGRSTLGYRITGHTDYQVQVNDQAEIATTKVDAKWDEATTRSYGGHSHDADLAMSASATFKADGTVAPGDSWAIDNYDGTLTGEDGNAEAARMALYAVDTPIILAQWAQDVWKDGKCFEVRPDPKSAEVDPNGRTSIKVAVYHWVDKADVQLPVTATLTGSRAIDPSGQPVTSPATFTYGAAGPGTSGKVEFKVVSRRGIASATGSYSVRGNLAVDLSGTLKMTVGGIWTYNLRITGSDLLLYAADDGSISATGRVSVKGTLKASVVPCSGTINERIDIEARGQLQGPPDAQVWHVQLGPSSENNLGQTLTCPYITIPSNEGDYFGQWSVTIGYVDLPASGGTIRKSGSTGGTLSRRATATFAARTR